MNAPQFTYEVINGVDSEDRLLGFKSQVFQHLLAVKTWESKLTLLSFSILTCKVKITVLSS